MSAKDFVSEKMAIPNNKTSQFFATFPCLYRTTRGGGANEYEDDEPTKAALVELGRVIAVGFNKLFEE